MSHIDSVCPTSFSATNWADHIDFGHLHKPTSASTVLRRCQAPSNGYQQAQFFGFSLFSNTKPYQSLVLLQAFDLSFMIRQALSSPFRRDRSLCCRQAYTVAISQVLAPTVAAIDPLPTASVQVHDRSPSLQLKNKLNHGE
jgi:hypothetical protein